MEKSLNNSRFDIKNNGENERKTIKRFNIIESVLDTNKCANRRAFSIRTLQFKNFMTLQIENYISTCYIVEYQILQED